MEIDHLVFLDESSIDTGMTRLYGRGASNERVADHTPDTRFERTSVLSSIRANGDMVPPVFEGSLHGDLLRSISLSVLYPLLNGYFI